MRRSNPTVFAPGQLPPLEGVLRYASAEAVAQALAPFATAERVARLREVAAGRVTALTVLMDAPHDPHNGAALVRTLDAFGVHALHVVEAEGRPFLLTPSVSRGAHKWVDLRLHARVDEAITALRAAGHTLVAAEPQGELLPPDLARLPRPCLVVGSEHEGIRPALRAACARSVRVPMRGFSESLNLGVTAAVLLSHALAGRPGDLGAPAIEWFVARGLLLSIPGSITILHERGLLPAGFDPIDVWRHPPPAQLPPPPTRNDRRRERREVLLTADSLKA
ncbi:MAG: RNA methyltransferase [Polyangiaceae bacterium]|jgi:tRNA (guanosine-2'-O-)-methyltransferase|nr:RNA methyltransferase [Polyangiaceae bacterium]